MKRDDPSIAGPHNGRSLALNVLFECGRKEGYVSDLLDKQLRAAALSSADRRLATTLAFGVMRRRGTLDALLRPLLERPIYKVEPWLMDLLRLGAFQLAFLTHVPAHAAIYETVELTEALQRTRAKGFVNGVLRSLSRTLTEEWTDQPAANAFPVEAGRYRKLTRPLLADPENERTAYLAQAFSLPEWLMERWLAQHGFARCQQLGFWFAAPAPMTLRCNALRCTRDQALQALAGADIKAEPGGHPQAIRLAEPMPVRDLPSWEAGWYVVQDESAMEVVSALSPQPGSSVLDLCAAPGGKTTHIAECMGNQGQIIACDIDEQRLAMLQGSCGRLGIDIIVSRGLDERRREEPPPGPFDAILVDAPCSNTGVLGRRPEARWRVKEGDLRRLVPLQTRLLLQACERIKPGGAIVYSTCSIEPDENRQVVDNVLRVMPKLRLEAEAHQFPGEPADGGYWARLVC